MHYFLLKKSHVVHRPQKTTEPLKEISKQKKAMGGVKINKKTLIFAHKHTRGRFLQHISQDAFIDRCLNGLGEKGFITTGKMKFSFSLSIFALTWRSLEKCADFSELSSQTHSTSPFLFIIHIDSALIEILIFDKDQLKNARMNSA